MSLKARRSTDGGPSTALVPGLAPSALGPVDRWRQCSEEEGRQGDSVDTPQSHRRLRRERSAVTTAAERESATGGSTGGPSPWTVDRVGLLQMIQRNIGDMTSTAALAVPMATGKLEASAPIVLDDVTAAATAAQAAAAGSRGPAARRSRSNTMTSSSLRRAWKMKYQDFVPEAPTGTGNTENFQKLVDRANDWLKCNREMHVKTCETVTWSSHDVKCLGDSECMLLTRRVAEHASNFSLRGLRLWVVPRSVTKPQQICFNDFLPEDSDDNIQSLVTSVNAKIHQNHLKGQIVTVETITIPVLGSRVDGGVTAWREAADEDSPYVFGLRVFYNREVNGRIYGTERALIGIKDTVPLPTDQTYEGFEDLIERANAWLKDQTDIVVTNFQSVIVQKNNGPHAETGNACFFSHPGVNRPLPVDYFRILRVAYLKPMGDLLVDLPPVYPLTFETFTPELVRSKEFGSCQKERLEKMNETFSKVISFLQTSGADLVCAETVSNPMQFYPKDNTNHLRTSPADEIKFLLTIRLYLSGRLHRVVDGSSRSFKRSSVASGNRSHGNNSNDPGGAADNEHPGPIFLRHVVNRRFKYRWLILAITAITCMTIVVIVSVVYSNL